MKEIKIKQIFGAHQIYQEIANYPPEGIRYLGVGKETKKGRYYQRKRFKEKINSIAQKLNIPRMMIVKPGEFDLVHSSRGIIPITNKPWVMDIEHVHSFFGLNTQFIQKKFWKRFIEKKLASKNCKAILCHCEATRKSFFHYLNCSKFREKIKILYPSSHIIPLKREKHKKVRILSIISIFNNKSGPQILKAFSKLEKKHKNVELWFKADVPKELKKKYNSKNIKYMEYFGDIIPREKLLKEIYSKCDIFLYPTLADSFGYSLVDALVAKLPIVTTNLFASPEIVENGKNGFIINIPGYDLKEKYSQTHPWKTLTGKKEEKFIQDLVYKLEILIKNKRLMKKMGEESFKKVLKGKFSTYERNKKLKKIYQEALK